MAENPQNVFDLFARLLFIMRRSLEDLEKPGRPPRWVRIARARNAQGHALGKGVKSGVEGLATALSFSVELAVTLRDILAETDATEAFIELVWDFIQNTDTLVTRGSTLVGESLDLKQLKNFELPNQFTRFKDQTDDVLKGILKLVPSPEDVANLGHELYRLLCVEQLEGAVSRDAVDHLNVLTSGKARLLPWAFGLPAPLYRRNSQQEPLQLACMGSRRVWQIDAGPLPGKSQVVWQADNKVETLVEFSFENSDDLYEINRVLEQLGYTKPSLSKPREFGPELTQRLRYFQVFNELPVTGKLDNATLNRLLNLDYGAKNVVRARSFDSTNTQLIQRAEDTSVLSGAIPLVNPLADDPAAEGLVLKWNSPSGPYAYYEFRTAPEQGPVAMPASGGWISDRDDGAVIGFVALESRAIRRKEEGQFEYAGAILSEGEAASGRMFFAARHVEPWKAGRRGVPQSGALFGADQPTGIVSPESISRLYQWVSLDSLKKLQSGKVLFIQASVLQRSLYTDRALKTKMPDQGRIRLEFYGADVFQGDLGTRRPPTTANKRLDGMETDTDWFPDHTTVTAALTLEAVVRNRNWTRRLTGWLEVPEKATGLLLALEGKHQSGWDIDAYFDNVELFYELREQSA